MSSSKQTKEIKETPHNPNISSILQVPDISNLLQSLVATWHHGRSSNERNSDIRKVPVVPRTVQMSFYYLFSFRIGYCHCSQSFGPLSLLGSPSDSPSSPEILGQSVLTGGLITDRIHFKNFLEYFLFSVGGLTFFSVIHMMLYK